LAVVELNVPPSVHDHEPNTYPLSALAVSAVDPPDDTEAGEALPLPFAAAPTVML